MPNPAVRPETPEDIAAIHDVTTAAFLNAPHTAHTEQFIVDTLRKAGALAISLVAEDGGVVIGHVAVSPVSISDGSTGWFGLGPISVSPELQRRGIGSLLMRGALHLLRERGAAGCVVVGDPAYYSRFGFKPEAGLVMPDVPPEYFQALPFGPSLPRGVVTFHAAFTEAGMHKGSCLCGCIRFTVTGELEAPVACHCVQCRRQSGHFFASTNVKRDRLRIEGEENLSWFQSSPKVRRGFCSKCGSWLFWDPPAKDWTSIAMGAFESPTGTALERHIFVAEKGDYYDLADGLPQNER